MISSVFELLICSGHTGRSLAQGPAPKAKTRFLWRVRRKISPALWPQPRVRCAGDFSLETQTWKVVKPKQSDAVPPGRRIGPKRCLRRGGDKPEVQAAQMRHSTDRTRMPVRPAHKSEVMRCHGLNAVRTDRRKQRTMPRRASWEDRHNRAHPADQRASRVLPTKALVPGLRDSCHVYQSNAWSARKRTMVKPRGLTASSLFFTLSRKT